MNGVLFTEREKRTIIYNIMSILRGHRTPTQSPIRYTYSYNICGCGVE